MSTTGLLMWFVICKVNDLGTENGLRENGFIICMIEMIFDGSFTVLKSDRFRFFCQFKPL